MTVDKPKFKESALIYAKRFNFSVFPLVPKDKKPLTKHGFKDATTSEEQIEKWWNEYPDANIGIATGKISNLVVVDIDGEEGKDSYEQLIEEYGDIEETNISLTGSGGMHILFQYPNEAIDIKSCTDLLGGNSKIDIRANGGYIVAPPSIHPNGKCYEWEVSSRLEEVKMAHLPSWLLNILSSNKKSEPNQLKRVGAKSEAYWSDILKGVKEGGRNDSAARLTGYFLRKYIPLECVYEILTMWNERNDPPLELEELEKIIISIYKKEYLRRIKIGGSSIELSND